MPNFHVIEKNKQTKAERKKKKGRKKRKTKNKCVSFSPMGLWSPCLLVHRRKQGRRERERERERERGRKEGYFLKKTINNGDKKKNVKLTARRAAR